ncbi:MAG: SEC59/DGK1/VTE5 family protein [Candidatus Bathyarchaeota archaeon]|nr:SEC59/DGK1/VTE5 family protein [Candidatus Bathyarchaeota archaeon]
MFSKVFANVLLMLLCYVYILLIIFVSSKMDKPLHISQKASRKFLHAMIGNLPFIIPFFTSNIYPALVAAPFILVTFFASPYSPFENVGKRLKGLVDITEEGHHLGLIFYAVSYTLLALFFASQPYVIAAGILPMAYGDSVAAIVGERHGRRRYKLVADKSLEGSAAMFSASFLSLTISLILFSALYPFSVFEKIFPALAAATVATLVESFSPTGFDNLTVPAFSALTFLLLSGGI